MKCLNFLEYRGGVEGVEDRVGRVVETFLDSRVFNWVYFGRLYSREEFWILS